MQQPGAANQLHLINRLSVHVTISIKARVLAVCCSGAFRYLLTQYHSSEEWTSQKNPPLGQTLQCLNNNIKAQEELHLILYRPQ